jgi:MFS transporter, DHA3 family, macrolide efflux protein
MAENNQASTAPTEGQEAVLANWKRQVALFLTGQTITLFGSLLVQYAIFWHLTLTTKSGLVLAMAAVFGLLPQAIVSVFGGVWADRHNRKLMIIIADTSIALATLILALIMLLGVEDLWIIFLVMVVRSIGAGFQNPAVSALIPQIVPVEKLMRVNGINSSIQSSLTLLAPVAAAAVYSTMNLVGIFLIDVVTALIGVGMLLLVSVPSLQRISEAEKPSYFTDLREGVEYIFTHKTVRFVMAIFAVVFLLTVAPSNLSALMLVRNFGEEVWMLTVLEVAFGIGMVIGGALMAIYGGKTNRIRMLIGTSIGFGFLAVALGLSPNLIFFYAVFFVIGLAVPAFSTSAMTLLQETVEPERQGRVFGFVGIVMSLAMPVGMVILGPLADLFPVEWLIVITGSIMVAVGMISLLAPSGRQLLKNPN